MRVGIEGSAAGDPPLLVVYQFHGPTDVFDAIDVVSCLPHNTAHAAQFPSTSVIGIGDVSGNGRHALREVQVVVGDGCEVVAGTGGVHPCLHVPVGDIGRAHV